MSEQVYEAGVYAKNVTYKNFKGEQATVTLYFSLDPIQLLQAFAGFTPKKSKSKNPALRGTEVNDDADQIKLVRDIAVRAACTPSEDGEYLEPFLNFGDSIVGQAFMTQLISSELDRQEFSEKVLLSPFRAFVNFASADKSNSPAEVANFQKMLGQLERVFSAGPKDESVEDRRARLLAELDNLPEGEDA